MEGCLAIDLDGDPEPVACAPFDPEPGPSLNLPRLIASAQAGSTVVALVDAKPPLLVSYDAGSTWRDAGRGLPPGRAVAAAPSDPDVLAYASRDALYLSRNGGVFWSALATDLPEVEAVAFREA